MLVIFPFAVALTLNREQGGPFGFTCCWMFMTREGLMLVKNYRVPGPRDLGLQSDCVVSAVLGRHPGSNALLALRLSTWTIYRSVTDFTAINL